MAEFTTTTPAMNLLDHLVVSWVIGLPPVIIHFKRIFHSNQPFLDTPIAMETPTSVGPFVHVCHMASGTDAEKAFESWHVGT